MRSVASVLRRWRAPHDDLLELLRACIFTITVGDADRHGKNVSVLHDRKGAVRLAPLYDVMCTRWYPHISATPGMFVNGARSIDEIVAVDFVEEAASWGVPAATAWQAVREVADTLGEAIEDEAASCTWTPAALAELLRARAQALRARTAGAVATFAPARVATRRSTTKNASSPIQDARVRVGPYTRSDGTEVKGRWRRR